MFGSVSKVLFNKHLYNMCVCKRFKASKMEVYKAIRKLKYENTQLHGPVRKQKKSTAKIQGNISDNNSRQSVTKQNTDSLKETLNKECDIPRRKAGDKFSFILGYPMTTCTSNDSDILKQENFVPSVTHIISETQSELSKFYLERWRKKMISEMGEKAFIEYQEATFLQGSNLHTNIQHYLSGTPESELHIVPEIKGHWNSIHKVLDTIQNAVALEEPVTHNSLCYRGKFDCIGIYRDKLCVIDWKTSKKIKATIQDTFDNPLQVAAYIGAINNSDLLSSLQIEEIKSGAIVIAYSDGSPAHIHIMDQRLCEENWRKWLERLHMYWLKRTENKSD